MRTKRVVVVGGGTGTYGLLRALKKYVPEIAITAIVTMADSGGSTGRLRDAFGYLPIGDVRQALAALAHEDSEHQELLRQLFLYRYEKGSELEGHNFGNLLLTALRDITGSEAAAISAAGQLLRVAGTVLPVTTTDTHLQATYDSGAALVGEHAIETQTVCLGERIIDLSLTPEATITDEATTALTAADLIVFGPGDLYTSILANVVVDGFTDALAASAATKVYVLNLMTKACQTSMLDGAAHIAELEHYLQRSLDWIIAPADTPTAEALARYQSVGETFIMPPKDGRVRAVPLIDPGTFTPTAGDMLVRSYIRHDGEALASTLATLW